MIIYDICCELEHRFEGWFNDPKDFGNQLRMGMLTCPVCGSEEIRRVPTASHLASHHGETAEVKATEEERAQARELLQQITEYVDRHFEDVGTEFADEARRIHYGEVDDRDIRGLASSDQIRDLKEEGITALSLADKLIDKDKLN